MATRKTVTSGASIKFKVSALYNFSVSYHISLKLALLPRVQISHKFWQSKNHNDENCIFYAKLLVIRFVVTCSKRTRNMALVFPQPTWQLNFCTTPYFICMQLMEHISCSFNSEEEGGKPSGCLRVILKS